jgi:hypothetical protein
MFCPVPAAEETSVGRLAAAAAEMVHAEVMSSYGFECKRCGERVRLPPVAEADLDIVRVAFLRRHVEACYSEEERIDGIAFDEPFGGSERDE